ncbi:MAG: hypothetical protein K2K67_05940, partial [Treponemataceae bacterium]|nr:hypothetical protein [Treponemataceae bacterium]
DRRSVPPESKDQVRRLNDDFERAQDALKAADVPSADEATVRSLRRAQYEAFMRLRHNIPGGFEMWEEITTNWLQLKTVCIQRANHRQREDWNAFIRACFALPHFCALTGLDEGSLGLRDIS